MHRALGIEDAIAETPPVGSTFNTKFSHGGRHAQDKFCAGLSHGAGTLSVMHITHAITVATMATAPVT